MASENRVVESGNYGDMIRVNGKSATSIVTFKKDPVLFENGEHPGACDKGTFLDATQVTWPDVKKE